ncbi:MAG: aminotransferase class I/II-fold pyridoxal phosphate-dependent enzyme [Clostridiales bacterium]|jgi:cystathionine beta-lyase|nr:aminotransferase class I/II-fold pyridoxal phosphate-dependent enzyme [Clostridiales bacterium]
MSFFEKLAERRGTASIKWDTIPEGTIGMGIADADWPTAPPVLDAINELTGSMPTLGYGWNDFGLLGIVSDWYSRKFGLTVPREWLVPIPGIVPAFETLACIAEGGVLVAEPGYSLMLTAPERAGRRAHRARLSETRENGTLAYRCDFDALTAKSAGAGTFFLCNPHNPIGYVYTRDELSALADFARRRGLVTISDEIHCELVFDGKHTPWFDIEPNSVTLIAAGKVCNMPGIRGAIAVVPDETLRGTVKRAFGRGGVSGLNAAAIAGAFSERCDEWKKEQLNHLRGNRDFLRREFRARLPKCRLTNNEATFLQWVDLTEYRLGDTVKFLRDNAKVALAGGADFGGGEGFVRVNFATSRARLSEAIDRIVKAVDTNV